MTNQSGSPTSDAALAAKPTDAQDRRNRNRSTRKKKSRITVILCLSWIALLVVVALIVQWLPLPNYVSPAGPANTLPHWGKEFLGTDDIGRSVLARLVYGDRVSLAIGISATTVGMCGGLALGLISVYMGGIVARIVDIVTNTVLAIPSLVLLLAVILALGSSPLTLIWAIGAVFIPTFTRLTRANAMTQMHRDFVIAARAMGASAPRLICREVLPNCIPPLVSYAVLVLPAVIIIEGTLSFLGFGVQPPTPSWGGMIAGSQTALVQNPWPALIPCIVLFITVFSLNTLGDSLRVKMDVRDAKL